MRALTLAVATLVALAIVPAALALEPVSKRGAMPSGRPEGGSSFRNELLGVHVRVEGKTRTIFGAAEPLLEGPYDNPLTALEAASAAGEFYYHVQSTSFGRYVDQIGRYAGSGSSGWVFKVNGVSPPVGADSVSLGDRDTVLWYYATFTATGGPPTLDLARAARNCYRLLARNDSGAGSTAVGGVLHVDGRSARVRSRRTCVGPHRGLVRGTMTGAIRSNELR